MTLSFGPRRGRYLEAADWVAREGSPLDDASRSHFESFDLLYRSLCALMYNYVPLSGHPGGSISSGRFVASLLFGAMDYDLAHPDREDADLIVYAAGHKALGLYAMWALRNEVARLAAPDLVPRALRDQLRLEDLLGFRRNPVTATPLFRAMHVKPLDGHPTPATPFVKVATGASGVGVPAALGLALAAADHYGADAPRVHIIEGEGGMTPGRVSEALAIASAASLSNVVMHVDWNQSSIDSNHVCAEDGKPGDYVQWNPMELAYLHDWNVIHVKDGFDWDQIAAAQHLAAQLGTGQPTCIVYRTVKGWRYGMEGRASHGAGHALCSEAFYSASGPLLHEAGLSLPQCEKGQSKCASGRDASVMEECYWHALGLVRSAMAGQSPMVAGLSRRLKQSRERLDRRGRAARPGAPRLASMFEAAATGTSSEPASLRLTPGSTTTLRDQLGKVLNHLNREGQGAVLTAAADLLGSTSVSRIAEGFPGGYYNRHTNPLARLVSAGGIREDAMSAMLSGVASFGRHVGVGSSYGAFNAPLGHIAARLHAIGNQARETTEAARHRPFFLVCAHAGLKTGEDGPTHADPQALQLLQENFPPGTMITLTPWDPQEIWWLVSAALSRHPAIIAPFVTRPSEKVPDRPKLGLAPASNAAQGVYRLLAAGGKGDGTLVLQESGVTYAFVEQTLPRLREAGLDLNVYYIASAELFDALSAARREEIFPEAHAREAMGITGFTLPTLYRWVRTDAGRAASLHPFAQGRFLGSGQAPMVLEEAGLDGAGQMAAIRKFVESKRKARV
jgi:transketolase